MIVKDYHKPCPFCGNHNIVVTSKQSWEEVMAEHHSAAISMECTECLMDLWEMTDGISYEHKYNLLLERWNRRP